MTAAAESLALAVGVSTLVAVLCERMKVPSPLALLGVGLVLGASGLEIVDGNSLGEALKAFITVAIGLLIFEGSLHLNREELGRAPRAVWGLLTIGALVTWAGAAALAHFVLGLSVPIALLLGVSVVVTGPTVVQPLLRRMRVSSKLNTVLGAEAVFIDPIGVVATIATLELVRTYYTTGSVSDLWSNAAVLYLKPVFGGGAIGAVIGACAYAMLRMATRKTRPEPRHLNLFAVGVCMTSVGAGEALAPEAGLSAVTVCGVIMAQAKVIGFTELRMFKEQIATMLVATLFVLLASRFELSQLASLGWPEAGFIAGLLLLVRPASVMLATTGSKLSGRETVFASLFAPRGIVALSVASIAATELRALGERLRDEQGAAAGLATGLIADSARLELLVFVVIASSVFVASTLGPLLAWGLRVRAGRGNGVLLIGGHALSRGFAGALKQLNIPVRVIDSSSASVAEAKGTGIDAIHGDATDGHWMDDAATSADFGWLVAWTANDTVNQVAARWAERRLGSKRAGIWSQRGVKPEWREMEIGGERLLGEAIDQIEHGRAEVAISTDPASLALRLARFERGRLTLLLPNGPETKPAEGTKFIGLRMLKNGDEPA